MNRHLATTHAASQHCDVIFVNHTHTQCIVKCFLVVHHTLVSITTCGAACCAPHTVVMWRTLWCRCHADKCCRQPTEADTGTECLQRRQWSVAMTCPTSLCGCRHVGVVKQLACCAWRCLTGHRIDCAHSTCFSLVVRLWSYWSA